MIKTLAELGQALNTLYPTSYLRWDKKQKGTFITYTDEGQEDFFGDDEVE